MNVLLTNDDGFDAEGLQVLRSVLSEEHDVWVMAPGRNFSGSSCSFSLRSRLSLGRRGVNAYELGGTPVDCVLNALRCGLFPCAPDVIVSGINSDSNIGTDVVYSGTCGAARQASLSGVPGIALSVRRDYGDPGFRFNYQPMARFALRNLRSLASLAGRRRPLEEGGGYDFFVNVNAASLPEYKGVRLATLAKRVYGDTVTAVQEDDGRMFIDCTPAGGSVRSFGDGGDDRSLVDGGYVAVSVIHTEPQCSPSVGSDLRLEL